MPTPGPIFRKKIDHVENMRVLLEGSGDDIEYLVDILGREAHQELKELRGPFQNETDEVLESLGKLWILNHWLNQIDGDPDE